MIEQRAAGVGVVIKIGGGLLAEPGRLDAVLTELVALSEDLPLVIVPGGGPFADAVRDVDRRLKLSDDAAHWIAILAMDQYAQVIVSRLPYSVLVSSRAEIEHALESRRLPVLAPYRWLREVDPLPHSWEVTSDSISAWVAAALSVPRLVLIKPSRAVGNALVDGYFERALPAGITVDIVSADQIGTLRDTLRPLA